MLRSFLPRPHPLLSRLHCHDIRSLAPNGRRADAIPSRIYTSSEDEADNDVDRPPAKAAPLAPANRYACTSPNQRKKHLYVVLDDWKKGFSIHKLDLDDDGSDGGGDLTERAPVHRQANEHGHWSFAALGNKIVAAGRLKFSGDECVTLVYDTETAGLSIVPHLQTPPHHGWCHAAAAGRDGLYVFVNGRCNGGVHRLVEDAEDRWSWSSIASPLPFRASLVESTAVHPDGCKVFASMGLKDDLDDIFYEDPDYLGLPEMQSSRTFSYDTGSGEWRGHGDWELPFYGHAHFDGGLDAWVGLHKAHGPPYGVHSPDGYICSCDVVSLSPTATASPAAAPPWKLCTVRLSDSYPSDGSLVYLGDSTYCLVEVVEREKFRRRRCAGAGNKCMIRLTTFRLKYGKNGELTITERRPDRSYLFASYDERFNVRAFWI